VEARDVRDAPTRNLNDDRRLRRRRALAKLRAIAAGRPAIPLAEILTPLGIPLTPRPQLAPLRTAPVTVTLAPTVPVHVAMNEQQIVLTADVRWLVRRLADAPWNVPPILLVCLAGRLFLNDGHHRLVASRLLVVDVAAEVHGLPDRGTLDLPVGESHQRFGDRLDGHGGRRAVTRSRAGQDRRPASASQT
jgi:hypothetical protein